MLAVNLRICWKSPLCCNRRLRIRTRGSNSRLECHSQHREVLMEAVSLFQSYLTVGRSSYEFLFSLGHAQPSLDWKNKIQVLYYQSPSCPGIPLGTVYSGLGKHCLLDSPRITFLCWVPLCVHQPPSKRLSWGDGTPFSDVVLIDRLRQTREWYQPPSKILKLSALGWGVGRNVYLWVEAQSKARDRKSVRLHSLSPSQK